MDTVYLLGIYARAGVSVEDELSPLLTYQAHIETRRRSVIGANIAGRQAAEWNLPYKVVLCPQTDQQGVHVIPDERTLYVETTHRTPKDVALRIAEQYQQIKAF